MVAFLKLVTKLTGEKAFWAWLNKEKVIEWIQHGFSFKWIERQIIKALAGK